MNDKTYKKKKYKKNNMSSLSRYMGTTYQTIYLYKKNKPIKFEALTKGWEIKCDIELGNIEDRKTKVNVDKLSECVGVDRNNLELILLGIDELN